MPLFAYKGRNARGEPMQGTLEGADSSEIANQLFRTGITPTEIRLASGRNAAPITRASIWRALNQKKVGLLDIMLFSRQMHTLLKSGVPIMRALSGLQESSQNPAFIAILQDLRESLDSGRELSAAMRRHPRVFSSFYVSMVQVGEMTGMLDETFMRLYSHLEFEKEMEENIRGALRYPTFVMVAMISAIAVINIFVIPAFRSVFDSLQADLPLLTRILIAMSEFTLNFWPLILAMAVGAVVAFRIWVKTTDGKYKWDKYKLRIPIAGKIIQKGTLARFARSLGLAFRSGIPIVQGLTVVGMVVDNEYMRSRVEQMRDGVERGESILRTASASGVFNPTVLQMIAVGEETGDMDGLMFQVAEMYESEVEYEVKTLSQQIEPILISMLGVMVLILALGVFLPVWSLGQAALQQ